MTKIFTICILLLFGSCFNTDSSTNETKLMNKRITRLEQRIDSLIGHGNTNSTESNNRCQAITKKGTQCKRKARNKGYCWQHGG